MAASPRYIVFFDKHSTNTLPWQLRDQAIKRVMKECKTEAGALRDADALNASGFHWRNGLYFQRGPEACVRIVRAGTDTASGELIASIPPNEWASIVSFVSGGGETGESYRAALKFHEAGDARAVVGPASMSGASSQPADSTGNRSGGSE